MAPLGVAAQVGTNNGSLRNAGDDFADRNRPGGVYIEKGALAVCVPTTVRWVQYLSGKRTDALSVLLTRRRCVLWNLLLQEPGHRRYADDCF